MKEQFNKIVLHNDITIEGYSWLSNTGKSYVVRIVDEDGVSRSQRVIPVSDIKSINGDAINVTLQKKKSIKYKGCKWQVTKVWMKDGYKWFRISGAAGGGRRYFKIIAKNHLEEYHFFKSNKKEITKGKPIVQCRYVKKVNDSELEVLRNMYKLYIENA